MGPLRRPKFREYAEQHRPLPTHPEGVGQHHDSSYRGSPSIASSSWERPKTFWSKRQGPTGQRQHRVVGSGLDPAYSGFFDGSDLLWVARSFPVFVDRFLGKLMDGTTAFSRYILSSLRRAPDEDTVMALSSRLDGLLPRKEKAGYLLPLQHSMPVHQPCNSDAYAIPAVTPRSAAC